MKDQIEKLTQSALDAIAGAANPAALEDVRIQYLSRSGEVPKLMQGMKDVPKEDKPETGKLLNQMKQTIEGAFEERKAALEDSSADRDVDPTLPGRLIPYGSLHPVYQVRDRAVEIFRRMGFALADGPDIETEYYNFDALNTPPDHPARNEQDTFYIDEEGLEELDSAQGRRLLRSQTSPIQIRAMEQTQPPVRVVAPGRCFRRDEIDATHLMSFHQIEGLSVDEGLTVGDLKGTLEYFYRELLSSDLEFRFRPHFFPFTEPSFEVDMRRPGTLIRGKEWVEICGCGMVDPNVLQQVDFDPDRYTGWAFGVGVERIAMLVNDFPDLRLLTENDTRFLRQFSTGVLG